MTQSAVIADIAARPTAAEKAPERFRRPRLIDFLAISFLAVLIHAAGYLRFVEYRGILTVLFAAAVWVSYTAIGVLAAALPALLARGLFAIIYRGRAAPTWSGIVVWGLAFVGLSVLQVLVFFDRFVFNLYGFHFNGFIWNLITTRGGIESMGAGQSSVASFTLIIVALVGIQAILLFAVLGFASFRQALNRVLRGRRIILLVGLIVACGLFERITYGVCTLRGYRPVLVASSACPMYMPTTITKIVKSLGMKVERPSSLNLDDTSLHSTYPRQPIQRQTLAHPPNLVWLVSESLRWDMLDPEIMPNYWQLAQQGIWCRQHYSGGNGTRMAMFSMFYGLYGCFWFPIFEQQRSPVIMDVMQQAGYQMEMFTSASFTYPEFDRTMFRNVPPAKLHEGGTALQWRRDQEHVSELIEFIDKRDPAKPFMTFMFFESPHSPYHFPKEAILRRDYVEDMNYATMDVHKDMSPIKNRYVNACHYLDSQLGRILTYLRERSLMDSTMIIITGDHGEEFMEKGRWGHNSEFTEEQTRPPLAIWIPGAGHHEITRMTSHLDIPATILPHLGVSNPPQDYSLGYDILGTTPREYTVIADWNRLAYVDENYKVVMPFNVYGYAEQRVTTRNDAPVTDLSGFTPTQPARLNRLMSDLKMFNR